MLWPLLRYASGSAVADDRTPYAFAAAVPLCPAGSGRPGGATGILMAERGNH
jgi:hypothetical protein